MKEVDDRALWLSRCRQARERFEAFGVTISAWAEDRGYPRELVYAVLAGRIAGKHGQAHQIAVELGLKSDPALADAELPRSRLDQSLAASLPLAARR